MEQKTIEDSLVKHLDVVEKLLLWALAIAVVVGWAGIRGQQSIEILGIKSSREDAYFVASWTFVFANLAIMIALLRMGDLAQLLEDNDFVKSVEPILVHPFLLNPFSYFGTDWATRFHSAVGHGLLIICWWVSYTAITTLRAPSTMPTIVESIFLVVGLASGFALFRYQTLVVTRLHKLAPSRALEIERAQQIRSVVSGISVFAGVILFTVVQERLRHLR